MATVTFSGTAVDDAGLSTPFSGTFTTTVPNQGPIINSVTAVPQSAPVGTSRTVTVSATDPEGGPLTYNLTVGGVAQPSNTTGVFTVVV